MFKDTTGCTTIAFEPGSFISSRPELLKFMWVQHETARFAKSSRITKTLTRLKTVSFLGSKLTQGHFYCRSTLKLMVTMVRLKVYSVEVLVVYS